MLLDAKLSLIFEAKAGCQYCILLIANRVGMIVLDEKSE